MNSFSPHTRGCSQFSGEYYIMSQVFPAYAGMFLLQRIFVTPLFPFSPHTRGCSPLMSFSLAPRLVFPAYAGMFLRSLPTSVHGQSFPRIRGDVPLRHRRHLRTLEFSPHTRGCSWINSELIITAKVFPAYAGMFRSFAKSTAPLTRFPRIRGDVPFKVLIPNSFGMFSPHTRGCSLRKRS